MESEAGEEALSHAAYHGQWDAVRLLIDKEVDVKSAAGGGGLCGMLHGTANWILRSS